MEIEKQSRFPGAKAGEGKEVEYDADFHKERIFGAHVQEYMETMKDEDEQGYQKLYSGSPDRFFLPALRAGTPFLIVIWYGSYVIVNASIVALRFI